MAATSVEKLKGLQLKSVLQSATATSREALERKKVQKARDREERHAAQGPLSMSSVSQGATAAVARAGAFPCRSRRGVVTCQVPLLGRGKAAVREQRTTKTRTETVRSSAVKKVQIMFWKGAKGPS